MTYSEKVEWRIIILMMGVVTIFTNLSKIVNSDTRDQKNKPPLLLLHRKPTATTITLTQS